MNLGVFTKLVRLWTSVQPGHPCVPALHTQNHIEALGTVSQLLHRLSLWPQTFLAFSATQTVGEMLQRESLIVNNWGLSIPFLQLPLG